MKKLIYILPVILLIISSCAGTKAFPKGKRPQPETRQAGSVLKDYEFNYPDLPPVDRENPYEEELAKTGGAKYHVALLVPLSGKTAEVGQSLFDAAQMAAFEKGGDDVAIVPYDTKGTGEGAVEAAYEAVGNNADIILGPLFGSSARKVAPIARSAGVKLVSFSNDQTVAGNGVYIMGLIPSQQVRKVLNYAERTGIKGVSAIVPNDVFGHAVKDIVKRQSKEAAFVYRGDKVYSTTYPRYSTAVRSLVRSYNKKGVSLRAEREAVMIPQGGEALARMVLAMQQQGLNSSSITVLGTALWDNPETLSISELDNAVYASVPYEGIERFSNNFMSSFGYKPAKVASLAYDAVDLAVQLSRSEFSGPAIINPRGFVGVNGAYRFNSKGLNERSYEVLEISNGQISVVEAATYYFD